MNRRLARILGVSLLLLSAGEVLLIHWAWLTFAGAGLPALRAAAVAGRRQHRGAAGAAGLAAPRHG